MPPMKKYSDEDLIDIMAQVAIELGRTPRMQDMLNRKGGPYPSLYQKRFASKKGVEDGWNNAVKLAGLDYNRKKPDQEGECGDCGVNGYTTNGRLIRWRGGKEIVCLACYAKRYYRQFRKESH
jgi:hypothetical protein